MKTLGLVAVLGSLAACQADILYGPEPALTPHFTAEIDGAPFVAEIVPPGCIGYQTSPTTFFLYVRAAWTGVWPSMTIHLGGITGTGSVLLHPYRHLNDGDGAVYVPGETNVLQYSTPFASGEVRIDEYDPDQRTIAGRFYFNAVRVVGDTGAKWVHVGRGSFRGWLQDFEAGTCS